MEGLDRYADDGVFAAAVALRAVPAAKLLCRNGRVYTDTLSELNGGAAERLAQMVEAAAGGHRAA